VDVTLVDPADIIGIARLEARKARAGGWMSRCPAHPDRERSMSLRLADDGRLLVNCFAGCRTDAIVAALGLELRDLFPGAAAPRARRRTTAAASLSPLDQARVEVLREARRQQERLGPYRTLFAEADSIRGADQLVARARAVGTVCGDTPPAWELLAAAADIELDARNLEAALDQLLLEKRLP
jgi:hypothetical protein